MITLIVIIVLLALAFDYTNGFHDTANAIATTVSTRALSPRRAVLMAGALNLIGALTFTGVAKTIGGKIADPLHIEHGMWIVLAALIAAISWNLFTWYFGIPSSSSHALIGGLTGAVIGAAGWRAVNAAGFTSILEALVISPISALLLGYVLMWILRLLFGNTSPHKVNRGFRFLQIFSAAFQAFTHGTNDAQKTMGIITFALIAGGFQSDMHIPLWVKVLCAIAMGAGTASGGWRIIKTVGSKIIKLEPINGFASDLTSATVILTATLLKLPVSSTHVISSAIMGTGAAKRFRQVNWGVALNIVIAWVLTIPISGLLAALLAKAILWIVTL
ncbi:inorganic phosphate transporter [Alicyclobacillus macrosporangiidus]|uniref:Inorganic phosphate transporter, PiT family n=1 Tax=Alicyclobacillus macrosporangiidus TaxID=392015 RepID=A0A1I7IA38_9BACL|nr:inorganic phosphate transporter [Alicyclobacillus macrosporangiidus]SFU69696.1 inorganic phosphate transporter, PiT family [Alicyclobacillus macrosporangiidus]